MTKVRVTTPDGRLITAGNGKSSGKPADVAAGWWRVVTSGIFDSNRQRELRQAVEPVEQADGSWVGMTVDGNTITFSATDVSTSDTEPGYGAACAGQATDDDWHPDMPDEMIPTECPHGTPADEDCPACIFDQEADRNR